MQKDAVSVQFLTGMCPCLENITPIYYNCYIFFFFFSSGEKIRQLNRLWDKYQPCLSHTLMKPRALTVTVKYSMAHHYCYRVDEECSLGATLPLLALSLIFKDWTKVSVNIEAVLIYASWEASKTIKPYLQLNQHQLTGPSVSICWLSAKTELVVVQTYWEYSSRTGILVPPECGNYLLLSWTTQIYITVTQSLQRPKFCWDI